MITQIFVRLNNDLKCYYFEHSTDLSDYEIEVINYLVIGKKEVIVSRPEFNFEVGPILNYKTPWCSNVLEIFRKLKINNIYNVEYSSLYLNEEDVPKFDSLTHQLYENTPNTLNQIRILDKVFNVDIDKISEFGNENGFSFDQQDIDYYTNLYKNIIKRNPTNIELFDLAQSNSEHSRHWFFNAILKIDGEVMPKSLFKLVKETNLNSKNSVIAFKDNASSIEGSNINILIKNNGLVAFKNSTILSEKKYHLTLTAETHNFPTGICPFPGAATGTGGRIRDTIAIGSGGNMGVGICGYCVGNLYLDNYTLPWEHFYPEQDLMGKMGKNILIQASNGASDYGNKIGEPVILGFTRSYGDMVDKSRVEWIKPIMFSAGLGQIDQDNIIKAEGSPGNLIIRVGGPGYPIGMGGGAASSRPQDSNNINKDLKAVQRGDPQMANRLVKFIRRCCEMGKNNPILSIHDQGSGGAANVTKEIIYPYGANIDINNITGNNMSNLEKWCAEFQEQCSILIDIDNLVLVKNLAHLENVPISVLGIINNSKDINIYSNKENNSIVNLPLSEVLGEMPRKSYDLVRKPINTSKISHSKINFHDYLQNTLKLLSVGSKRFLTNKVDRSVTGLVAQQQCVGPYQTPISNYGIMAQSLFNLQGSVVSIGEQPLKGIINPVSMAGMCVGEMLTNIIFANIERLENIKCAGNWMWSPHLEGEGAHMYDAVQELSRILQILNVGIDGGKDSLSMYIKYRGEYIKSPRTLVLTSYTNTNDITKKITPNLKHVGSNILFIDLGYGKTRLGGSALSQVTNQIGSPEECPSFENVSNFSKIFEIIQNNMDKILSGHDRSDGGLIGCLIEMSISSGIGMHIAFDKVVDTIEFLFNEELGLVIEVSETNTQFFTDEFANICPVILLGKTTSDKHLNIDIPNFSYQIEIKTLRKYWEETSINLELLQANNDCVEQERQVLENFEYPKYNLPNLERLSLEAKKYTIGVLRDDGTNGDKELIGAFYEAGFNVIDINMNYLLMEDNINILNGLRGLAFAGGFSYSDVFGSSKGWASIIKYNKKINDAFNNFYNRDNTFSIGICNGCQLMSLLGWVPKSSLIKNDSERFESRFSNIKVSKTNSIFFEGLEDTTFGMWVAHGEGKFEIEDKTQLDIPINYVDNFNNITEQYPFNPNGSSDGVAGISSKNGRHLAMMPHPERSFLNWQVPWIPENIKLEKYTPWIKIFENAYSWCDNN